MYFDADGVTPTPQENVDAVGDFWTALTSVIDAPITWEVGPEVPVIDEENGELVGASSVTAATGAGTAASDSLPYMTQGLVRLSTNDFVAGRRVRGRIFVPGATEDFNAGSGIPTSTYLTAVGDAAEALIDGTGFLIWSRPFAGAAGPPVRPARLGSKASITGSSVWNQWAVMRSRRD